MTTEKDIVFSTAVQYVRELDVPEWSAAAERVMRQHFDALWVKRGFKNYGWAAAQVQLASGTRSTEKHS